MIETSLKNTVTLHGVKKKMNKKDQIKFGLENEGGIGLENDGNISYQNSVIQSLTDSV